MILLGILGTWEIKDLIEVFLLLVTIGTILFATGTKTGRMESMIKELTTDVEELRKSLENHKTTTDARFESERNRQETALERLRFELNTQFTKLSDRLEIFQTTLIRETGSMRDVVNVLIAILNKKNNEK